MVDGSFLSYTIDDHHQIRLIIHFLTAKSDFRVVFPARKNASRLTLIDLGAAALDEFFNHGGL